MSTQAIDKHMINVHYYYVHYFYYLSGNAEEVEEADQNMIFEGNSLSISLFSTHPATSMWNTTHATRQPLCSLLLLNSCFRF